MKGLAVESSNAESVFQQLDRLRMVHEEYLKLSCETIPQTEKHLKELAEDLDQKSQALDDVMVSQLTTLFILLCDEHFMTLSRCWLL